MSSFDGWSINRKFEEKFKDVFKKLIELENHVLFLGRRVLSLDKELKDNNIIKDSKCQVNKSVQSSQKVAKPTKTVSVTKARSKKGKKVVSES